MSAKGSTVAIRTVVGNCPAPPILGTPEDFQDLNGQFLGFREMVKLTRMGKTHKLNPVVSIEILLRQMEHVGKNTQFWIPTPGEDLETGEPPKSHGTSEKETRNMQQTCLGVY